MDESHGMNADEVEGTPDVAEGLLVEVMSVRQS